MKKVLLLAAILAVFVTMLAVSASYAAIGKDISNRRGNSDTAAAPRLGGSLDESGKEYPVERIPAPAAASQEATDGTSDLAGSPGADDRKHLAITAQNLDTIGQQVAAGKIPEDQLGEALDNEVHITNQYLVERKIIRQELTPSQLLHLLRKLGYWGGATWGKTSVDRALREKLLFGRTDGATSNSDEWRQWLTREEFAVGLMRTLDQAKAYSKAYTDQAIGMHKLDRDPHPAMRRALEERIGQESKWGKWAFWLALLALLIGLIAWLRRRRMPVPVPVPIPAFAPFPAPVPMPPVVLGGGIPVVAMPTPMANGTGTRFI